MKLMIFSVFFTGLLSFSAFSYSQYGHETVAKSSVTALKLNNYSGLYSYLYKKKLSNGKSYSEKIWESAFNPDIAPLSDDVINQNSSYSQLYGTYNFRSKFIDAAYFINGKQSQIIGPTSFFIDFGIAIVQNMVIDAVQKWGIAGAYSIYKSNEDALNTYLVEIKAPTQHTYVADDPDFNSITNLTCAPYAAEAEYNLAKKYWNSDRSLSLEHLGRTLHYVGDICVPHHNEMQGNIWDLLKGIEAGGNLTTSSQYTYETGELQYFGCDTAIGASYNNGSGNELINNLITFNATGSLNTDFSLPALIISLHNTVIAGNTNRSIFKCDGLNGSDRNECCNSLLSDCDISPIPYAKSHYFTSFMNYSTSDYIVAGIDMGTCYNGFGDEDNMYQISHALVPLSITSCVKVIAKFFKEVEDIDSGENIHPKSGRIIPILLNLLLND